MANSQTEETESPELDTQNHERSAFIANRAHNKFGLGVGLTFVAVLLFLCSFVLIWLGIFPGLIAIAVAIPMAIAGVRLLRQGQPATTTQR